MEEDILPQALSVGTIFRLHACGTDGDCAGVSINYGRLATPRRRAKSQYSQAGDDILTTFTYHQYYRPALTLSAYLSTKCKSKSDHMILLFCAKENSNLFV